MVLSGSYANTCKLRFRYTFSCRTQFHYWFWARLFTFHNCCSTCGSVCFFSWAQSSYATHCCDLYSSSFVSLLSISNCTTSRSLHSHSALSFVCFSLIRGFFGSFILYGKCTSVISPSWRHVDTCCGGTFGYRHPRSTARTNLCI